MFRSHLLDYFKSGYGTLESFVGLEDGTEVYVVIDRGHMVPAADAKISQRAMDETFLLSNVAPQVGDGFNRHCSSTRPRPLGHN
jgi:endonuclease G